MLGQHEHVAEPCERRFVGDDARERGLRRARVWIAGERGEADRSVDRAVDDVTRHPERPVRIVVKEPPYEVAIDVSRLRRDDVFRHSCDFRLARVILLLVQSALFLGVVALLIGALVVDRSGVHGRDYLVFEERAVRSQQLTLAAFVLVIVEFLVGTPLLGAVLAILAALWTLWWLPAEHRRFDVNVQSVFDARPEAVAAVMFDISEQPRWMDSIVKTVLETPGLLRKGSVIRQTLRVSGQDLIAKLVVVEHLPYERLLLQVIVRHAELFDRFEVQPHPNGSIVTYSGRHQLSRLNAILTGWRLPALRRSFAARRTANLERLRAIVQPAPIARRA